MSHDFVSITNNIADMHTNTCDMYKSGQRHIHDPVISSQDESYTWYIFFFHSVEFILLTSDFTHLGPCNLFCFLLTISRGED
jgi:hypothetical protein